MVAKYNLPMKNNNQMTALIAVKGNSERIEKKNIRPFYNTNLLELKLSQLSEVKGIDSIIVSSENEKCLSIAEKNGVKTHFRDKYYSKSSVPMSEVYSYLASEVKGENIIWVPVTNPLADKEVYENAIETYKKMGRKYDCLLSACELKDYVFFKNEPIGFKVNPWPRSQDLNDLTVLNFVVNILKRSDMVKWGSLVGHKPLFYFLDRIISWDIDFQEDFDFCEMLYKSWNK